MLIQRYAKGLWPRIRGEVPFVVRGLNWELAWRAAAGKLFDALDPATDRPVAAEFMLRERMVDAVWAPNVLSYDELWRLSIEAVAREIPKAPGVFGKTLSPGIRELLEGMSTLDHWLWYLSDDKVQLSVVNPPA